MKGIDSVDPVSESDKGGVIQVVGDATDDGVGRVRYPSGRENIVTGGAVVVASR
jgi:hypothetical protein